MDESSSTLYFNLSGGIGQNHRLEMRGEMRYFVPFGFGFGFIHVILEIIVVIVLIWLLLKLGKLADAYIGKLKAKTQ